MTDSNSLYLYSKIHTLNVTAQFAIKKGEFRMSQYFVIVPFSKLVTITHVNGSPYMHWWSKTHCYCYRGGLLRKSWSCFNEGLIRDRRAAKASSKGTDPFIAL